MTRRVFVLVTIAALLLAVGLSAWAAERPGVVGLFGKNMAIGKGGPLFVTLKSAEFVVTNVRIGDQEYVPSKDEKLLVVHLSLQNPPKKSELWVGGGSIRLTAIDNENTNREYVGRFGIEGKSSLLNLALKQAQKVDVYTVIFVPARGAVPKLIVLPPNDTDPVIRFDLRGKVKALPAPFADPTDKSGFNALPVIPGKLGTWCAMGYVDVRVDKVAYSTESLPDLELEEGARFLVATCTFRNRTSYEAYVSYEGLTVYPLVECEDGQTSTTDNAYSRLLLATSPKDMGAVLKTGKEIQGRYFFVVPSDVASKTLKFFEEGPDNDASKEGRQWDFTLGVM